MRRRISGPSSSPQPSPVGANAPGPIETALVQRTRVVASDFQIETRWPIYAGKALVRSLRACWAEPVDAGEGLTAIVALFHAEPAEPNGRDERVLRAAASIAGVTVKGTQHRPARGIYPRSADPATPLVGVAEAGEARERGSGYRPG